MRDVNVHVPLLVKMLFGLLFPPIRLLEEIEWMLRPTLSFYETSRDQTSGMYIITRIEPCYSS